VSCRSELRNASQPSSQCRTRSPAAPASPALLWQLQLSAATSSQLAAATELKVGSHEYGTDGPVREVPRPDAARGRKRLNFRPCFPFRVAEVVAKFNASAWGAKLAKRVGTSLDSGFGTLIYAALQMPRREGR
jgi:hypothetical protein